MDHSDKRAHVIGVHPNRIRMNDQRNIKLKMWKFLQQATPIVHNKKLRNSKLILKSDTATRPSLLGVPSRPMSTVVMSKVSYFSNLVLWGKQYDSYSDLWG